MLKWLKILLEVLKWKKRPTKKEGLAKKYSDCCKEEPYENMALSEEEKYYIENNEKEKI